MKNNTLKYILFSLILLFGTNFYNDRVYAKSPFVDSGAGCPKSSPACKNKSYIPDKITCTYKPIKKVTENKNVSIKGIGTFQLDFRLEMSSSSGKKAVNYDIVAYNNGSKLSNYESKNYDYSYDCPKSIAYYNDFNNNSHVYASKLKDGNSIWVDNACTYNWYNPFSYHCEGKTVTIYTLESAKVASDAKNITPVKDCEFVSDTGTKAKFKAEFDMDGANTDILAISFYLSTDGGTYKRVKLTEYKNHAEIYNAITSGDCNDKTLSFMYRKNESDFDLLYFSEANDIVQTGDTNNVLDGNDQEYSLYKNINIEAIIKDKVNEAFSKVEDCDNLMKKNCKDKDDDSEKCREAKEQCYAAQTILDLNCSGMNKKLMNNDQKAKCDEADRIITNYKSDGFTFEVNVVVTCETLGKLRDKLQTYFNIIKFLTPVLIIGLSVVDFVQATTSSDDDAFKKAKDKFVKRLIIGVIIFLLPYLVDIVLQLIDDYYQTSTCGIK